MKSIRIRCGNQVDTLAIVSALQLMTLAERIIHG
jgi:hypothetical protein